MPYHPLSKFERRSICGFFILLMLTAQTRPNERNVRDNRLTAQHIDGVRRVCVYGSGRAARVQRVGLGEPCPFRILPPEEPAFIPSMAVRIGEDHDARGLVCTYRLADRVYQARLPGAAYCPLTPVGNLEPMTSEQPR